MGHRTHATCENIMLMFSQEDKQGAADIMLMSAAPCFPSHMVDYRHLLSDDVGSSFAARGAEQRTSSYVLTEYHHPACVSGG